MQLMKAGQAEQIVACLGDGIAKAIAQAKAGHWSTPAQVDLQTLRVPLAYWLWQGAVARVTLQPTLRRIGPGYLVRENTGEIFSDEEEKGSCIDPLYSADSIADKHCGRE